MNKSAQLSLIESAAAKPSDAEAIVERAIAQSGPGDDGFDWDAGDDSIVVRPRRGVAIYRNRRNDVVVRTQGDTGDDEDNFAFLTEEALPAVIKALKECLP